MKKQEKWLKIVGMIEDLGYELQELVVDELELDEYGEIGTSLMGLRMSIEELHEQRIKD